MGCDEFLNAFVEGGEGRGMGCAYVRGCREMEEEENRWCWEGTMASVVGWTDVMIEKGRGQETLDFRNCGVVGWQRQDNFHVKPA